MGIATELVTFRTVAGMESGSFIEIVGEMERAFHRVQPGFIDTELLYNGKAGEWMMIQHWESLEEMKAASPKMFGNPVTARFVEALDPKSVKMLMLPQLGKWRKADG